MKKLIVDMFGGKCQKCGYNKCIRALSFHHRNPKHKKFAISSSTKAMKCIIKEAEKCDLLCANCHMEIHDE